MHFLATGKILHRNGFDEHLAAEKRVFDELRAEGVLQEAFFLQPGPGVVGVIVADSPEAAHAQLQRLPFVATGILEFELVEVVRA
jgi:hypothetical protein